MIHILIAVREKIDAKCMTVLIGKAEEYKEEAQRAGDSLKSAETVLSGCLNGQAYA